MFDIDGTLVQSMDLDTECFVKAVNNVLGITIDNNWSRYKYVTDSGIINEVLNIFGLESEKQDIEIKVKHEFLSLLEKAVESKPITQIEGASKFLEKLKQKNNVTLSIATGGWLETAQFKLKSANIDSSGIPICSSNEHFDRVEIMKLALSKSHTKTHNNVTYFGDGAWDKNACVKLGFNFVLVGNKIEHHKRINSFSDPSIALEYIGL